MQQQQHPCNQESPTEASATVTFDARQVRTFAQQLIDSGLQIEQENERFAKRIDDIRQGRKRRRQPPAVPSWARGRLCDAIAAQRRPGLRVEWGQERGGLVVRLADGSLVTVHATDAEIIAQGDVARLKRTAASAIGALDPADRPLHRGHVIVSLMEADIPGKAEREVEAGHGTRILWFPLLDVEEVGAEALLAELDDFVGNQS